MPPPLLSLLRWISASLRLCARRFSRICVRLVLLLWSALTQRSVGRGCTQRRLKDSHPPAPAPAPPAPPSDDNDTLHDHTLGTARIEELDGTYTTLAICPSNDPHATAPAAFLSANDAAYTPSHPYPLSGGAHSRSESYVAPTLQAAPSLSASLRTYSARPHSEHYAMSEVNILHAGASATRASRAPSIRSRTSSLRRSVPVSPTVSQDRLVRPTSRISARPRVLPERPHLGLTVPTNVWSIS
jgi:hypothetical protein